MKKIRALLFLPFLTLLLLAGVARAQDETRSVQEELRRRSLYFGDVNGRDSAELQEATKRYQQRKGFTPTGKRDRETLKSLGLVPRSASEPPPPEVTWPDEPVLPSDARIDAGEVARALNEETGIAPAAVAPKGAGQRGGARASTSKRGTNSPAAATQPTVTSEKRPANSPNIAPAELTRFATDYLAAMGSDDIRRQLKFYADTVDYYRNGRIDRRIIEQTLRRYQARWPSRRYTVGRDIRYSAMNSRGEITMTFPVSFSLSDGRRTVKGQTENRLAITAATLDPRIASISEQRIRR